MSLASKVKALRAKGRESLQELADIIEVSKAHLWDIERGASKNPSLTILKNLAEHYKISMSDLVGEDPNSADEPEELIAMYRDLKTLSPEDREMLSALMEQMKRRRKSNGD
jgi:transcriptional regulator with XRE-family HTH domain